MSASGGASPLKGYWEETKRPIYSLALVFPFLLIYEIGVLVLDPKVINGGDAIIRRILGMFSVHAAFVSAMVLLVVFIGWQIKSKASWRIDPRKLMLQYVESGLFAVLLFLFLGWLSMRLPNQILAGGVGGVRSHLLELVLYCGAGVYEELVFRVMLLGLLMLAFTKLWEMEKMHAAAASVLVGAVLFSLFHYVGGAEQFALNSFFQRTFAGIYFSAIYVTRSFGVAAASHALYDILVGVQYSAAG